MTCQQAVEILTGRDGLTGSDDAPDALERHLADCAVCAGRLRSTEPVRRLLREVCQRMQAPQALRARIAGALPHRAA